MHRWQRKQEDHWLYSTNETCGPSKIKEALLDRSVTTDLKDILTPTGPHTSRLTLNVM